MKEREKYAANVSISTRKIVYNHPGIAQNAYEISTTHKKADLRDKEKGKLIKELVLANNKLLKIAFMQSHHVRVPIANILGLFDLFNFNTPSDPINGIVLNKLKIVADSLDKVIREIVQSNCEITSIVK